MYKLLSDACAARPNSKKMRGGFKKAVSSGLLTNHWEQADWTPAGFEEPLQRLRSLVERTQQPAQCSSLCPHQRQIALLLACTVAGRVGLT